VTNGSVFLPLEFENVPNRSNDLKKGLRDTGNLPADKEFSTFNYSEANAL